MAMEVVSIAVIPSVPAVHLLVQAIQPVRRGRHIRNFVTRHTVRHKRRDRVADEHVRALDVPPQILPDVILGRPGDGYKVAANLNV